MAPEKQPLSREQRRRMAAARGYAGGLSHLELGKKMNVSRDTVQRAESGETKFSATAAKAWLTDVAIHCDVPVEFLIDETPLHRVYAVWNYAKAGEPEMALAATRPVTESVRLAGAAEIAKRHEHDLDELVEAKVTAALDAAIDRIREHSQRMIDALNDNTREAITATRAVTREAQGRAVAGDSSSEAAADTHGEEGATQESAQSQRGAKP